MKLLIVTQKIDIEDPVLGFMHRWVEVFAKNFEKVIVICLEKGEYNLPGVQVLSLGKEIPTTNNQQLTTKFKYILNFLKYVWQERKNYDAVFVHMNQEYVLIAGDLMRLLGKKVYLWRNHGKGSILTDLAGMIADKVFYTSPSSYTARFRNSVQMPVGIDTDFFKPDSAAVRKLNSALFLGRISPIKKVSEFIDWIKSTNYNATIAGPIADEEYWESVMSKVKSLKLDDRIKYVGPVNQAGALRLYQTHEFYVNKTPAGSFDKTIFEALACGCKLIVDNPDAQNIDIEEHSLKRLVDRLKKEME